MSVYVIAEAGVNHNGSEDTALQLIDAAANSGADAGQLDHAAAATAGSGAEVILCFVKILQICLIFHVVTKMSGPACTKAECCADGLAWPSGDSRIKG